MLLLLLHLERAQTLASDKPGHIARITHRYSNHFSASWPRLCPGDPLKVVLDDGAHDDLVLPTASHAPRIARSFRTQVRLSWVVLAATRFLSLALWTRSSEESNSAQREYGQVARSRPRGRLRVLCYSGWICAMFRAEEGARYCSGRRDA